MQTENEIALPVTKAVTAWGAIGITSWAEFASALAALYTLLLLVEWLWVKLLRPFAERKGWIASREPK